MKRKRTVKKIGRWVIPCALMLWSTSASALPDRITYIDIGVGTPQLIMVQAAVVAIPPRWQFGAGYGTLPIASSALGSGLKLPQPSVSIPTGQTFSLASTVGLSWDTLSPFVRFFPADNNFYFQLTYAMLQLGGTVSSTLTQTAGIAIPDTPSSVANAVQGTITITQLIPTISIGNLFTGKLFFFNLSLGASFLWTSSVDVNFTTALPSAISSSIQPTVTQLEGQIQSSIMKAANAAKNEVFIIPSLNLSFGIIL